MSDRGFHACHPLPLSRRRSPCEFARSQRPDAHARHAQRAGQHRSAFHSVRHARGGVEARVRYAGVVRRWAGTRAAPRAQLETDRRDDVAAFQYYLSHYNQGRPIVIASHSQGSYHAVRLLQEFFDGKELQKQLVVAYLVGRAIPAISFQNLKPSEKPEEVGVWASWCTFGRNYLPDNYEKYYKNAISVNPLLWNTSEDFAPKELNKGGVGLKFTVVPQLVDAQNHQGILWVNKPFIKGRTFLRSKNWHRADMNFFYMNIRENVALRVEGYLTK